MCHIEIIHVERNISAFRHTVEMLDITKLNIELCILPQHENLLPWQTCFKTAGYCHFSTVVSHWVLIKSYHFLAFYIHWLSAAQATAGDISAPLNSIVWVERDAYESLQLYIWNHTPIPLRTRASLHSTKQCKVVHRPSAIFRCEGSKSITEGRYWDSWISTSNDTGVIMHLYLSTSSSLCPYHDQIHFSVSQYCVLH